MLPSPTVLVGSSALHFVTRFMAGLMLRKPCAPLRQGIRSVSSPLEATGQPPFRSCSHRSPCPFQRRSESAKTASTRTTQQSPPSKPLQQRSLPRPSQQRQRHPCRQSPHASLISAQRRSRLAPGGKTCTSLTAQTHSVALVVGSKRQR